MFAFCATFKFLSQYDEIEKDCRNADRNERYPQATRIIDKFGNARRLSQILKSLGRSYCPSAIYRWTYPHPKGRGGKVPTAAWDDILAAARSEGILITSEDMDPRPRPISYVRARYTEKPKTRRQRKKVKA